LPMSVKRRDLIRYLEENGFSLLREGGNHSI
jgi:predicted RNA binding protein YcfA (HicA-like mRNA interferase family)